MNDQDQSAIEPTFEERLVRIESTLEGVRVGVNTIGEMMNGVASMFDQMMTKVNNGGLGAILGGLMGGKKDA